MSDDENSVSGEEEQEDFVVESIIDKKIEDGATLYYIKWKDYPDEDNTWEPEANLECEDLIAEFEENLKKKKGKDSKSDAKRDSKDESKKRKKDSDKTEVSKKSKDAKKKKPNPETVSEKGDGRIGFDRGLQPEKIIGAIKDKTGHLRFLMKWKNSEEADLVASKQANLRCPQIVIAFYEERLTWAPGDDDD